ncbi:MAG: AMP-binding protein [Bacilli bacterium]
MCQLGISVPKIFSAIHKKFGGEVKFWISGGAALDRKVWRDLSALGFGIREGYGMTECAPIITFPRIGNVKVGSPGEPLPGVEIRIIDGEIAVRGGNVTSGYYNRPQETSESIRNGWLYTGDLGYIDEDGFLFITGRRRNNCSA